ncbi:MAG: extracellular solute-binding protein [Ardenticatenales bacterium]|nr:extracellular solute-binding protein [Ardenticatenales bacterium]
MPFRPPTIPWFGLLLCLSFLLSTGCGATTAPLTNEPAPSTRQLTLWHSLSSEQAEILQGLADEWSAQQSTDVTVRLVRSPDEEALHQKLLAAIQTEMPPTLAFVRPADIASYVDADALLPLDSLMEEGENALSEEEVADYYSEFFESSRYAASNDALYAWPVHRYQTLLFLNRTRILELGGEVPPPSWEAMVQVCAAHRQQGGDTCMAAFPTGNIAVLWLWSHNGSVLDEKRLEPTFQGEAGQSVMQWLAALRAVGGVHQVPTYDAKVEAFVSGKTLFNFDSTAEIPTYEARINSAFDMAVVPPPSTSGTPVTYATGGNVAIFRGDAESQALAWDFLRFWTSTESNYRWAAALDAYPVRRSALEKLDAEWPEFSRMRQAAEWLPYSRSEPMLALWPQIEKILAEAMINTINGQETPEQALETAARRVQGLLKP